LFSPKQQSFRNENKAVIQSDECVGSALFILAVFCSLIIVLIFGFLLIEAWPLIGSGRWLNLFQDQGWYPLEGEFGISPMIWATIAMTFGAIVLALPMGLFCGVFLSFYSSNTIPWIFRWVLNLLAGIPSVVYGLWGLTELVPLIAAWNAPGTSLLAGIFILTLMILPTVALTSTAALSAVDPHLLSGALALGFRHNSCIFYVVVPAAKTGIINGALLATARALGETMAVLMVAGNVVQNPTGLLEPVRTLTGNIALEMAYAMDEHRAGLFASGLLLTVLVLVFSLVSSKSQFVQGGEISHG